MPRIPPGRGDISRAGWLPTDTYDWRRLRVERVLHDHPGRRTYVLNYTPDEALADGDYTLRVSLGEANEQLEAYALIRLRSGS